MFIIYLLLNILFLFYILAWDAFYIKNETKFFKDRHWLQREFDDLKTSEPVRLLEVGCGVGNTAFPLLKCVENAFIFACDYSCQSVQLVLKNPEYDPNRMKAFTFDLTSPTIPEDIVEPHSIDIITCIFVLSALDPKTMGQAVKNIDRMLKPGGVVLFRGRLESNS